MDLPTEPTFREIAHGSNAYRAECALRQEVLRRPLGLRLEDEDLNVEAAQWHFGLFAADVLLACVLAVPLSSGEVKLRQMAVQPDCQGRGYGRDLLGKVEVELSRRGFGTGILHARASAVAFYAKLGFEVVGGEFLEVGIPHCKMSKFLALRPGEPLSRSGGG